MFFYFFLIYIDMINEKLFSSFEIIIFILLYKLKISIFLQIIIFIIKINQDYIYIINSLFCLNK
jgi:hypothetical protein